MKPLLIILFVLCSVFCKSQDSAYSYYLDSSILQVNTGSDSIIVTCDSTIKAMENIFKLHGKDRFNREYVWTTRSKGLINFPTHWYEGRKFLYMPNGVKRNRNCRFKLLKS